MTARGERKREEKEEESKRKKKAGRTRGKAEKKKREILQSWYHMAGPPFLMRQRSMYSLALSHTGGTSIMPKLTCSNKPPLLLPPTQPHPCRPRPGSARLRLRLRLRLAYPSSATHLHSPDQESPASFHRNSTLTESDSCHQTEKRNLAFALIQLHPFPSIPSTRTPLLKHTHKQIKRRDTF